MVHSRYNEKEVNPNPCINFITNLPDESMRQDEARQLLRALAAQVKPLMKQHGFQVNSFEEYEYNEVFAGRNWNNGETIEIVLRKPDGSFYQTYWLMSTLCHELAHIKHMDHGPAFQALWSRLRTEVRQLQARGYYGDGFWSSGTRLRDLARIGGDGAECDHLPEYLCGGAQTRSRPTASRRRVQRGPRGKKRDIVPSLHTGAQTNKKRKAGTRVTSKFTFTGDGVSLSGGERITFGKRANSKRAREERALAAERRVSTMQDQSTLEENEETISAESGDEMEIIPETDAERRKALWDSEQDTGGLNKLHAEDWRQLRDEFRYRSSSPVSTKDATTTTEDNSRSTARLPINDTDLIEISSDDGPRCGVSGWQPSGSTFTTQNVRLPSQSSERSGKERAEMSSIGPGGFVQSTINFGDKGDTTAISTNKSSTGGEKAVRGPTRITTEQPQNWHCLVCTLENKEGHLACSACGTPKGNKIWTI